MCRADYGEFSEVQVSAERKAVKPHKCAECGRIIEKGEIYRIDKCLVEGSFITNKTCSHCDMGREWLARECGGWFYEKVVEEIQEHAEEYSQIATPLYRFVIGARRQWARFDGVGRMPVPARLPTPKYV